MASTYVDGSPFVYYFAAALVLALTLLIATVRLVLQESPPRRHLLMLLLFWTLLPPAWFAVEYFQLYSRYGISGTFEQFKYGQELASKFWVGGVALVAMRLLHEMKQPS